jgi:hypothetical protein
MVVGGVWARVGGRRGKRAERRKEWVKEDGEGGRER